MGNKLLSFECEPGVTIEELYKYFQGILPTDVFIEDKKSKTIFFVTYDGESISRVNRAI